MLAGNEECDDGNVDAGDGCSNACTVEKGFSCANQACGSASSASSCTEVCGDGVVTNSEACDDANVDSNDGCSNECIVECGYVCVGEGAGSCSTACGDGMVAGNEECDDGNADDGDGCSADCSATEIGFLCSSAPCDRTACNSICGDGIALNIEQCDDRNLVDGDGCSSTCSVECGFYCNSADTNGASVCVPQCGDAVFTTGELCDDGNVESGDGCSEQCEVEAGFVCQNVESCGRSDCLMLSGTEICGDGKTLGAELDFFSFCDDSNTNDGDGCSGKCTVECGFECNGGSASTPHACESTCGDGILATGEVCDDGNNVNGDGCSWDCSAVEQGFLCQGVDVYPGVYLPGFACERSVCVALCGDGLVLGYEECDDSNLISGDGCSMNCVIEVFLPCTNVM